MAITVIKELIAKFSADTSGVEAGSSRASSAIASFGKSAALAAAGAAAAFAALAIHEFSVGDELGKASDRAGEATDKFIELGHATEMAGLSTDQLSNVLKFMQRNVYNAAAGNKELELSLKRIGTSSKELLDLTPAEAFKKIIAGLGGLGSAAERTEIAMKILGRSGTDVLSLAQKGGDYFKKMADEADRFGLSISRVDAKSLEDANNSVKKIGDAAAGAARQFDVGLAPAITVVNERILKSVDASKLFKAIGLDVGEAWVWTVQKVSNALLQWEQLGIKVGATLRNVLFKGTAEEGDAVQKMADAKIQAIQDRLDLQKAGKADSFQSEYDAELATLKKENQELLKKKNLSMGGGVGVPLSQAAIDAANKAQQKYAEQVKKSMETTVKYNDTIADQFIAIKDGFVAGGKAADTFKKVALDAISSIANNMIKLAFGGSAGTGIFGSIASSLMGGFGGPLGGGTTVSKQFGTINWLPSYAVGTNYVPKDMVAQIHEGEQIIPKGQNKGGSGTVIQNISVQTGVAQTVRAEMLKLLPQIRQVAVQATSDASSRRIAQ